MTTRPSCRNTVLAVTASIVFSGCSTPLYVSLLDRKPPSWSYGAEVTAVTAKADEGPVSAKPRAPIDADTQWWASFSDPLLLELVMASQAHPSVEEARSRWNQAAAVFDSASSAGVPSLGLTLNGSTDGNARISRSTEKSGSAQLGASWEPDLFGRIANNTLAASKSAEAAQYALAQTKVAMAASTATTYVNLLRCDSQAKAYYAELDAYQLESSLLKARQAAGLLAGADQATFELRVEQAKATLIAQLAACKQYRLALIELTGWTLPKLETALATRGLGLVSIPNVTRPAMTPASVLERRPDIQVAIANAVSAEASAQATDKNQLPHISLTGMLGLSAITGNLATVATTPWSVSSTISWVLFSGGKLKAERKQAKAVVREKTAALDRVIRKAIYEVETAVIDDKTSFLALKQAENNLVTVELMHESTKARAQSGLIDGATLVRSERDLIQAKQAVDTAKTQHLLASISLYKALGGALPSHSMGNQ